MAFNSLIGVGLLSLPDMRASLANRVATLARCHDSAQGVANRSRQFILGWLQGFTYIIGRTSGGTAASHCVSVAPRIPPASMASPHPSRLFGDMEGRRDESHQAHEHSDISVGRFRQVGPAGRTKPLGCLAAS